MKHNINTYQAHEALVESLLDKYGINYKREGVIAARGFRPGVGKFDFKLSDHYKYGALECKVVKGLNKFMIPRPKIKTVTVKPHQLKALRKHNGTILIHDSTTSRDYSMTPNDLDQLIIECGIIASLCKGIDHLEIDLETFISKL